MVLIRFCILSTAIIVVSCSGNQPVEQTDASPEKKSGKALFLQHCAMCHGEDGQLGVGGAANLTEANLTENRIRQVLANGKNAMPAMISQIGNKQAVDSVISYTLELTKNE